MRLTSKPRVGGSNPPGRIWHTFGAAPSRRVLERASTPPNAGFPRPAGAASRAAIPGRQQAHFGPLSHVNESRRRRDSQLPQHRAGPVTMTSAARATPLRRRGPRTLAASRGPTPRRSHAVLHPRCNRPAHHPPTPGDRPGCLSDAYTRVLEHLPCGPFSATRGPGARPQAVRAPGRRAGPRARPRGVPTSADRARPARSTSSARGHYG